MDPNYLLIPWNPEALVDLADLMVLELQQVLKHQ